MQHHAQGVRVRRLSITLQNIMIDKDFRIKLIDFGLARGGGGEQHPKENSNVGTPHFMAPEISKMATYSC